MILSTTGHRPSRSTFPDNDRTLAKLTRLVKDHLRQSPPICLITGMAMGFDMACALACVELGLPYTAAVPFAGQELRWSAYDQKRYQLLLRHAHVVHVVGRRPADALPYSQVWTELYHARNAWMVDNSDRVLTLWDGRKSGGTHHCVRYARSRGKPVENLWAAWKAAR